MSTECSDIQSRIIQIINNRLYGDYIEDGFFVIFLASIQQHMLLENTWIPSMEFVLSLIECCKFLLYPELASIVCDIHIADQARLQNVDFVVKSRDSSVKKKMKSLLLNLDFEENTLSLDENELLMVLAETTKPSNF